MKKHGLYSLVLASCVLLLSLFRCTFGHSPGVTPTPEATSVTVGDDFEKMLYIVHEEDEIEKIKISERTSSLAGLADHCLYRDVTEQLLTQYDAFGVPYDVASEMDLSTLFSAGQRVYVYGDLTIRDYEDLLGTTLVTTRVVSEQNSDHPTTKDVTLTADEEHYSVIGWTTAHTAGKGLLCTIDNAGKPLDASHYYLAISNHYLEQQNRQTPCDIELIDEGIDHVSYYAGGETHLDWYLRQDLGEQSVDRDYYCIENLLWAEAVDGGSEITSASVKTELPSGYGALMSTAPQETSSLSGSISIDFASETLTLAVSCTNKPSVSTTVDRSTETAQWEYTGNRLIFKNMDDQNYPALMSWNAPADAAAKINVYYKSSAVISDGTAYKQGWQKLSLSF